ncbi:T9SS type A sorting domain-containing protein, partial [uncultured Winogradskyella sp.]
EQKLDTNATFNSVNVSNLTSGVYIIELKGQGNQKLIKKVVVR